MRFTIFQDSRQGDREGNEDRIGYSYSRDVLLMVAADARLEKDRLIPLRTLARQQYSDELYDIVEACLRLDHLARPQTAFELQKLLMAEPQEAGRKGFLDTLNKPISKLFTK